MQGWQTTFLGMRELPRDISDFEMKTFFTFDGTERQAIDARRGDAHKLGLALHIGFLRMSGRLLYAFRVVPVALWRHLSEELSIATPDVDSLRTLSVHFQPVISEPSNGTPYRSYFSKEPRFLSACK